MSARLAVVCSHPIQYYAPWFRNLTAQEDLKVKVFFLWNFGVTETFDPGFERTFIWDVPLLDGYESCFVPNTSTDPGTHHFGGLSNPSLFAEVLAWKPDAVLLFGYAFHSLSEFLWKWNKSRGPLLLRGDSHRLASPDSWKQRGKDALGSLIFKKFDAFLYCGIANKDYFVHRGALPSELFFVPHAIDTTRFNRNAVPDLEIKKIRAAWGATPEQPVVLFAGKFETKKRPLDLVRAFQQVGRRDALLVFVGSGPLEKDLGEAIFGRDNIRIFPFENQSRMPAIYCAANLFVLPSQGIGETWGLAVQEALNCGTPVIVSSHVGCHPDLVHGNGTVFEAGSVAGLTQALRESLAPDRLAFWKTAPGNRLVEYSYPTATQGLKNALDALGCA
jgi:glycosyltransferase involved in cell wall biosynthesis